MINLVFTEIDRTDKKKKYSIEHNQVEKSKIEELIKGYEAALHFTDKESEPNEYAELSNVLESNRAILKRLN